MTCTVFQTEGCVCLSGGFTPGYRDTVFQTGGLVACWSEDFTPVMEVLPSRQQGVVRASGGSTPVMEVPSSRRGAICTRVRFQTE